MHKESTQFGSAASVAAEAMAGRTLRAVEYLRVSTQEQAKGYGVASQQRHTRGFIAGKSWDHVGTFCDEGFSGSLEMHERPDLMRLMEEARQDKFDVVVVKEGRSIGRTGRAFWRWVWVLEDMGICVAISSTGTDNTTDSGRKEMRRQADYAETEWETIRARTTDGLQEKAEEGGWIGGPPPFGYMIAQKGEKKLSHLVIHKAEAITLRRAWELIVQQGMNVRQAAIILNAKGLANRRGMPWTHQHLLARLTSTPVTEAVSIYRHTSRPGNASSKSVRTKLGPNGKPLYGNTVRIPLDPIFAPWEITALRKALKVNSKRRDADTETYPLSGRLVNPCGKHATGIARASQGQRWYRCSGKEERYAGSQRCSCPLLNADAVEKAVWGSVVELLQNPTQMAAMAEEWRSSADDGAADHQARIDDFDAQIASQERAASAVMTIAAKNAVAEGKSAEEVEAAVSASVQALNEELRQLRSLRQLAVDWLASAEESSERGKDLQALAAMASEQLATCSREEQRVFLDLLDVTATVKGPPPVQQQGRKCMLSAWFRENWNGRVTDPLSDDAWQRVEPLLPGRARVVPYRTMVEAILHKARMGIRWEELPAHFGNHVTIHTRCAQWLRKGLWGQIMEAIGDEPSSPLPGALSLAPPMDVRGGVDPRLAAEHEPARADINAKTERPRM